MKPLKRIRSHKIYSSSRELLIYNVTVGITQNGNISVLSLWERRNRANYHLFRAFKELPNGPDWSHIKIAAKVKRKDYTCHLGNKDNFDGDLEIRH
jgi:hypothetical protein